MFKAQLASLNASVSQSMQSNSLNTQLHNATITQPQTVSPKLPNMDQQQLKIPLNTTDNPASNLYTVPITYGANQTKSQTLDTLPSRDQLKKPNTKPIKKKHIPSPAKTQTKPSLSNLFKLAQRGRMKATTMGVTKLSGLSLRRKNNNLDYQ